MMERKEVARGIFLMESIGFGFLIFLQWFIEIVDIPSMLFNVEDTPFNWRESTVESLVVVALAILTISATSKILKQLKYIEGFLPVCSHCKKIRIEDGRWLPIEQYIAMHSDAVFTHSYCPECMVKYYGIED